MTRNSKLLDETDLSAKLFQNLTDKVLSSVSYPFTAVEYRKDFPKPSRRGRPTAENGSYVYSATETSALLKKAVDYVQSHPGSRAPTIYDDIFSFGGSIIEQAKKVSDVSDGNKGDYKGPDKKKLDDIVKGGIQGLVDSLGGDFGLQGWCSYLQVVVSRRPTLGLASPRIDLSGVDIDVTATGELWANYPWWNCYEWCTQWEKVNKWALLISATLSVRLQADAYATLEASGPKVIAYAAFNKLRLGGDIFDKIPLEGLANAVLRGRAIDVYDASKLVETVPLMQSKFVVKSIQLPVTTDGIVVGITVKQL